MTETNILAWAIPLHLQQSYQSRDVRRVQSIERSLLSERKMNAVLKAADFKAVPRVSGDLTEIVKYKDGSLLGKTEHEAGFTRILYVARPAKGTEDYIATEIVRY